MMTPASSAQKILLGTGLGLLMASGLALISGLISINNPSPGFIVIILGVILTAISFNTKSGTGILSSWFPEEDNENLRIRVEEDLAFTSKEEMIGSAWARLEHTMLSKELEGEE